MKTLTEAELKSQLRYDPEQGTFTRLVSNNSRYKVGTIAGSVSPEGYIAISLRKVAHQAHRLAFLYMTGEFPPNCVDHINGNRADNRWKNLRLADRFENAQNKSINKNNTTGWAGVYYHADSKKYYSHIRHNGKQVRLGIHLTAEEAGLTYLIAKGLLHKFNPSLRT